MMLMRAVKPSLCIWALWMAGAPLALANQWDELGKSLTPMGAERAGNAAGTIPAWTGGLTAPPSSSSAAKDAPPDPFRQEKPLYTITRENLDTHKALLAPGQQELFKRYPTFSMKVYRSQRTAAYRPELYQRIQEEAPRIRLAPGGNGVMNRQKSTVPFPIPKQGVEVIWNHITRDLGGSVYQVFAFFPVHPDGNAQMGKFEIKLASASEMVDAEPNRLFYYKAKALAPSTASGEIVVVHEPLDQSTEARLAWQYNPGQRRVVRAPELGHDSPGVGADSLRTIDDFNMFNGSPERFDWKLLGKREMLVPYNNTQLLDRSLKYSTLIKPLHPNQDYIRYEPHRVWVVEGTLKPGMRHVYSKRVFFVDEDSWTILHGDQYDARGTLWRIKENYAVQYSDRPTLGSAGDTQYDLQSRRYIISGLKSEEEPNRYGDRYSVSDFSQASMRRAGR